MAKKLYCIRHGEATHNILFKQVGMSTFFDKNYYDTELTDVGFNQAIELGNTWEDKDKVNIVLVSPLSRTLQTAMNVFKQSGVFKQCNIKIIALDCLKEYPQGLHTCNKRKSKSILINKFPEIDFSLLDSEEDNMWSDTKLESIDELLQRMNKMYDFIDNNNYENICLVGHNSFISMIKDQKLNRNEDGLEELKHCHPYKIDLNYNK
jgi:broad specificity phosphatase PhoE